MLRPIEVFTNVNAKILYELAGIKDFSCNFDFGNKVIMFAWALKCIKVIT